MINKYDYHHFLFYYSTSLVLQLPNRPFFMICQNVIMCKCIFYTKTRFIIFVWFKRAIWLSFKPFIFKQFASSGTMSKANQPSRTLYIANFPKDTQKHHLEQLFSPYGKIANLAIVNKQKFSFAFADFETYEDAKRVQQKFDQKPFGEMNMKVSFKEKRDNGRPSYQRPNQYSTGNGFNGQFKGASYGQKSSYTRHENSKKPDDKDQSRSDSSSSRSRENPIDRVPRERSRSKGFRRKGSSQQSSGRHSIRRRPTDNRARSISKDSSHAKPRYTQTSSREDSKKIINLQKQALELSEEVHYLTKRLIRVENQFQEFIEEYSRREYSKRR